jgi:hypothetical protein
MAAFLDFEAIKASVSYERAIALLGITMSKKNATQWRSVCPACGGDERTLVVTEGQGFYCWRNPATKKGGDVIAFVAHVKGISMKEAAELLSRDTSSTVPQVKVEVQEGGFKPLDYLEHAHEAVVALGFNVELCKELGIGYAGRGILRGTVAIPVRDEHGVLRGYVGATDLTIPPSFMSNVVPLKKKA